MKWFSRSRKQLPRRSALGGRPIQLPIIRREDLDDGRIRLTVAVPAPNWIRWLGGPSNVDRTFRLDSLGREVYEGCDGKTNVKTLIREFAANHRISLAEAEISVTTFLKTLIARNLIAIEIDRKSP